MVRRSLQSFALVLLASCAQTPAVLEPDPAPAVPTTLSTEFTDGAVRVITATDGGAYVLGYRHVETVESNTTEFYASRFDVAGKMQWLTVLPSGGLTQDSTNRTLSGVLVDGKLYVSAYNMHSSEPLILHKLESSGELLWSREVFSAVRWASDLVATPDGRLYLNRALAAPSPSDPSQSFLTALDAEGNVLWEREEEAYSLAPDAEGNVYLNGFRSLKKYGADGTLLWSEELEPSVPGFLENAAPEYGPFSDMFVQGDDVYLTMTYLYDTPDGPDNAAWNTEVRRYAADGSRLWTKLLYPEAAGDTSIYLESSPLGVGANGSLYILQEEGSENSAEPSAWVLRVSPDGELDAGEPTNLLQFFGGPTYGFAFTSATLENVPDLNAFYAVGSTDTVVSCKTSPCPLPDAYLSLYAIDEITAPNTPSADLVWSAR